MDVISDRVVEQLAQKFNFPTSAQVTPSPATTHPLIGIGGALGVTTPPAVASIPNPTIGVVGSTQSGQTEPPMIGVVEASQTTAANSAVMALLGGTNAGTMVGHITNADPNTPDVFSLSQIAGHLISAALAPNSQAVYRRATLKFAKFSLDSLHKSQFFPVSINDLILFNYADYFSS